MFGDISKAEKIYIACGYTDMRKSIDGLAAIVQQNYQLNPFQNSLFLFCGRRRDRLESTLLGRRWICSPLQAIGKREFSMANEC